MSLRPSQGQLYPVSYVRKNLLVRCKEFLLQPSNKFCEQRDHGLFASRNNQCRALLAVPNPYSVYSVEATAH